MDLRHLKYFVAVAEELSFSRAARRMYLSQPALSQQIRKLEASLGVRLFNRTKRRVELTEAGEVLLEGARRALMQIENSVRAAREVGGAERSHLRVSFPEYANHTAVADILQTFQRRYPYVELEEHEMFTLQQTLQQVEELREGRLDVGFLLAHVDDDALSTKHVLDIELVAALPEEHALAANDEVPMRALADERIILFSRRFHPYCYDYMVRCCEEAGFEPDVVQRNEPQLYSGAMTYRMVASGVGIGIVARPLVAPSRLPGVVFRPLREPSPALELAVTWRREDPSPNLRAFLEVVWEFAPSGTRTGDPVRPADGSWPVGL
ncbi:MAG: LysR substrate-binding domain-containing protein [Actinomycetota bacterium]|nr:LysR substrate-binding domain-containing protein [Actinomycetota bacterium]